MLRRSLLTISLAPIATWGRQDVTQSKEPDDKTLNISNGRYWNALSSSVRVFYLIGLVEGWHAREDSYSCGNDPLLFSFYEGKSHYRYGELEEFLNSAYAQPENRSLPITWVMAAAYAIQRGNATTEHVLPALRKHLSKIGDAPADATFVEVILKSGADGVPR